MTAEQNIITNQSWFNFTEFSNSSSNSSGGKSIFWFTEAECTSIAVGFLSGALIGSFLNSSVLVVLCHVLYRDAIKSGSDFLIAVLTSLDLCATTLVFILEGFHFSSPDCNEATSDFLFALTFFLESSSAFSLLNVALFRYSKICLVNIIDVDFKHTVYMSMVNILVSVIATILALFSNNPNWHALAMMTYLLTIFLVFILMGVLYFTAYWALRKRSQQARLRNAKRHNFANMTNYNTTPIVEHQFGQNGNSADQHQAEFEAEKPTTSAAAKVKIQIQPTAVEKNNAESSPTKTAIELMTERSAKVFIAITLLYFVCFMPNAILTFLYLIMGPKLYQLPLPTIAQVAMKYCNLFYNLNFLAMPLVYAKLNKRFMNESRVFFRRYLQPYCARIPLVRSASKPITVPNNAGGAETAMTATNASSMTKTSVGFNRQKSMVSNC